VSILIKAGWSKKAGREPYGSEGTCVEIEIELDDALLASDKRDKLMEEIKNVQLLAKSAVEAELAIANRKHREALELERDEAATRDADRRADEERERREAAEQIPYRERPAPRAREGDYRDDRDRIEYRDERSRERPGDRETAAVPRRHESLPRESRGHGRPPERRSRSSSSSNGNGRRNWKRDGGRPTAVKDLFGYAKDWDAEAWFKSYGRKHDLPGLFSEWTADEMNDALDAFDDARAEANGVAY
jgi:hypothetical protein